MLGEGSMLKYYVQFIAFLICAFFAYKIWRSINYDYITKIAQFYLLTIFEHAICFIL